MKTLAIVVNDTDFFLSHRLPIALEALNKGYDVHIITAFSPSVELLSKHGLKHHSVYLSRKSMNPFQELLTFFNLLTLFRKIRPDIVHLVTIKPVIYGTLAARLTKVPAIIAAITGMGSAFIAKGARANAVKTLISSAFRLVFNSEKVKVIFQNSTDRDWLVNEKVVKLNNTVLIRGSGVDLQKYHASEEPSDPLVISCAARLLRDKGIYEFVAAAETLKKQNNNFIFQLIGAPDPSNPTSIPESEIQKWKEKGIVEILGHRNDINLIFAKSHIVVLPSYREGLPKVLVEASACGRPVITTDVAGCKDAIIPNETGLLIPIKDPDELVKQIKVLAADKQLRKKMGAAGRQLAEQEFDIKKIVDSHIRLYDQT